MVNEKTRLSEVRNILISQPDPENGNSPYDKLRDKYKVNIDFKPFIQVEPVPIKEFRRQRVEILNHSAVIFTSRNAVDHFFKLCSEIKIDVPADMKYFCISDQTSNYLQKYIVIRKRKIFTGSKTAKDLIEILRKHKNEKFLFPCSNIRKNDIPDFLTQNEFQFTEAVIYKTVACNLSHLPINNYDVIAFFSPSGIKSLYDNFPDFKQNKTRIAAFGPSTAKAAKDAGLIIDILAPQPEAPSMTGALELYIKGVNKVK
jgi:uroporphyrinogen-III synthase